ncbi:TPM domain-containing protein [Bacillus mexicanus]|uniref:TPM domain-containing protein n=1 Tax=Bacillus mexicanus TaxID=2834415 RepID=UPI003D1CC127
MKKFKFIPLLFLVVMFLSGVGVAKATPNIPEIKGDIYVQDFAHIFNEKEKAELLELGKKMDDKTSAQISVVTVDSLENRNIEEYSVDVFRKYGLGDKEKNNGVLILFSKKDKEVRIEIGYGLEGAVTDIEAGDILDEFAIPFFKKSEYSSGLVNTYKEVFNKVAKEYKLGESFDQKVEKPKEENKTVSVWVILVLVILIVLDIIFLKGTFSQLILSIFLSMANSKSDNGPRIGGGGSSGGGGSTKDW